MERTYKYKYIIDEEKKTIVALSSFAGEVVRGVARCAPDDEFDVDTGKKLAEFRCALKIAHKRLRRAEEMLASANEGLAYFQRVLESRLAYEKDAIAMLQNRAASLAEFERKLN